VVIVGPGQGLKTAAYIGAMIPMWIAMAIAWTLLVASSFRKVL
jgi:hypothetical protein